MDLIETETWLVNPSSALDSVTLSFGTLETGSYGNGFNGQTAETGVVSFEFESSNGRGLTVRFDAFDIDFAGEVLVYLNGLLVGIAAAGANDAMSNGIANISSDFVIAGMNELQFVEAPVSDGVWGITNISLTTEPILRFGQFEQGLYGNRFGGAIETDGVVSFQIFHTPTEDMTLYVRGYDIDYYGEVEVFLNGVSIGYMAPGANNELTGSAFDIPAASFLSGANVVSFEMTGSLVRAWGVTDLILLNAGINVSTMSTDPEFSDDGWVTWMDRNAIYLGRYDTNSGALLEIVNVSEIKPMSILQSLQGPELIQTSNGMAAIGISSAGLIYIDENETYLLEGTEGYRIFFMPKGEVDGLRFTMVSLDYFFTDDGPVDVLLYDNGVISVLDFGDPTTNAVAWLNADEVVVFSDTRVGVYNIETGDLVWFTDNIYESGYSAALETEGGERYIVMQAGEYFDIWQETSNGWELVSRIQPPPDVYGIYLYSPELFEWNGRLFISGMTSELLTPSADTALVIYDIENDTWSQMSPPGQYLDPEVFVLENGSVAVYYRDKATKTTVWFVISYEEVMALAVPGGQIDSAAMAKVSSDQSPASTADGEDAPEAETDVQDIFDPPAKLIPPDRWSGREPLTGPRDGALLEDLFGLVDGADQFEFIHKRADGPYRPDTGRRSG